MTERGRPRSFDRQKALERAMETFWAKGFDGTAMTDLTLAMGIGSPSLYAAFGSKEALFREAVALYVAQEGSTIRDRIARADTARDAVEAYLMTTARVFSRADKPKGCMVVLSALHPEDTDAAIRDEMIAQREQNVRDLAERLEHGVATGEIAATADVDAIARFYVTVQQGMSIQARDGAGRKALSAIAHAALAAWRPLTSG